MQHSMLSQRNGLNPRTPQAHRSFLFLSSKSAIVVKTIKNIENIINVNCFGFFCAGHHPIVLDAFGDLRCAASLLGLRCAAF
jgi:hypothetical protein